MTEVNFSNAARFVLQVARANRHLSARILDMAVHYLTHPASETDDPYLFVVEEWPFIEGWLGAAIVDTIKMLERFVSLNRPLTAAETASVLEFADAASDCYETLSRPWERQSTGAQELTSFVPDEHLARLCTPDGIIILIDETSIDIQPEDARIPGMESLAT